MKTLWCHIDVPTGKMRNIARSRFIHLVCIAILLSLTSGCFFRSLVGYVDGRGGVSLSGNVVVSFCNFDIDLPTFYGCNYTIRDNGVPIEITSTFELVTNLGIFGALIDPMIFQLPANATNLRGTYNNAGADQPLLISLTNSFFVRPDLIITPEPGTQFAVLELPDSVIQAIDPNGEGFDFTLQFDVPPDQAKTLSVKPMLTARVDRLGGRFYLPVFPCVTDFAQIPEVQIPVDSFFQDLRVPAAAIINQAGDLACDSVVYDFTGPIFTDQFERQSE